MDIRRIIFAFALTLLVAQVAEAIWPFGGKDKKESEEIPEQYDGRSTEAAQPVGTPREPSRYRDAVPVDPSRLDEIGMVNRAPVGFPSAVVQKSDPTAVPAKTSRPMFEESDVPDSVKSVLDEVGAEMGIDYELVTPSPAGTPASTGVKNPAAPKAEAPLPASSRTLSPAEAFPAGRSSAPSQGSERRSEPRVRTFELEVDGQTVVKKRFDGQKEPATRAVNSDEREPIPEAESPLGESASGKPRSTSTDEAEILISPGGRRMGMGWSAPMEASPAQPKESSRTEKRQEEKSKKPEAGEDLNPPRQRQKEPAFSSESSGTPASNTDEPVLTGARPIFRRALPEASAASASSAEAPQEVSPAVVTKRPSGQPVSPEPQPEAKSSVVTPASGLPKEVTVQPEARGERSEPASDDPAALRPGLSVSVRVVVGGQIEVDEKDKRVSDEGYISLPLLGDVYVGGLTMSRLTAMLKQRYSEVFISPLVLTEFSLAGTDASVSPWGHVTVLGKVMTPGRIAIPATKDLTVSGAIQACGGLAEAANESAIRVSRQMSDGTVKRYSVDLQAVAKKGRIEEDLLLRSGDVVFVPEDFF